MVQPTVLPPSAEPRQLTAQHRPTTLEEHYLAFMASNNPRGYSDEDSHDTLDMDQVGDILIRISQHDRMPIGWARYFARRIIRLINESLPAGMAPIPRDPAFEIIARVFGYANYHQMSKSAIYPHNPNDRNDKVFINLRKQSLKDINLKIHSQKD